MNRYKSVEKISSNQKNEEEEEEQFGTMPNKYQEPLVHQNDLRYRLYDKGFSIKTMPSVKRHEPLATQGRPLSAKLYSFKNKLSPLIYQPQPTILDSTNMKKAVSSQTLRGQTAGMGSAKQLEPLNNQIKMGQTAGFGNFVSIDFQKTAKNGFFGSSQAPLNMEESVNHEPKFFGEHNQQLRPTNSRQSLYRPTSTNNLNTINPVNRLIAIAPLSTNRPITSQQQPKFNHTAASGFFNPPAENTLNAAKGTLNESELKDTRVVLDKITGKHAINPRFFVSRNGSPKGLRPVTAAQVMAATRKTIKGASEIEPIPEENVQQPRESVSNFKDTLPEQSKRQPTTLDKYIELILKNVTNVDEFVYLEKYSEDDPYDLRIIEYAKLSKSNPKEYFTISMKGLCHYVNGKPTEFISLAYWLKERETYDRIKGLSFFVKFRRWKTLKMWRKNINKAKVSNVYKALEKKLFILHPRLSETLRIHRKICLEMEELRFIDLADQIDVQTLAQFAQTQENKRKKVNERIQSISKRARDNIERGLKACIQVLHDKRNQAPPEEDLGGRRDQGPQSIIKMKENAYEKLGFTDNMSYEQRLELREECSRFLRFSYLVDFLALESLSNIYTLSINDLVKKLEFLNQNADSLILRGEQQQTFKSTKDLDPLLYIKLNFSPDPIDEEYIEEIDLEKYEYIEGKSDPSKFDIIGHVYLESEKQQAESDEEIDYAKETIETISEKNFVGKYVPSIHNLWLHLEPTMDEVHSTFIKAFSDGMTSLQAFERWSKHEDLAPYADVLEDWDDMVGDDWEIPDSCYLNPSLWVNSSSSLGDCNKMIRNLLNYSFDNAAKFMENFIPFLNLYWKNTLIDYDIFKSEKLANPVDTIKNTLILLDWEKEYFEKELPHTAILSALKIDCKALAKDIIPSPAAIHKEFERFLPEIMRNRVASIKKWMAQSSAKLNGTIINIDQYVKQSESLREITRDFPDYKEKLATIQHIYATLQESHIDITKEDIQALNQTLKNRDALAEDIRKAEEGTERNLERFIKDVTNSLIPLLEKNCSELDARVCDPVYLTKDLTLEKAIEQLRALHTEYKHLEYDSERYKHYEKTLGIQESRFDYVESLKMNLDLRALLWNSLKEWKELTEAWISGKFNYINTDEIKTQGEKYTKIVMRCAKDLPQNPILDELKTLVFNFKETMPVVIALRNKHLKENHMEEIKNVIGHNFELHDDLTLRDLIEMNVVEYQKEIQEISTQATQEAILEQQLADIDLKWKKQDFIVKRYKEETTKDVYIIGEVEEIMELLDESLANLNNILGSRYLKTLRPQAEKKHKDLLTVQDTLDEWLECQKNWQYLENIFAAGDIKTSLKQEAQQFDAVDKYFKAQMKKMSGTPNVLKNTLYPDVLKQFRKHNETLSQIQKKLEDYLETKRRAFPRFYFLSNDELLEILSNSNSPQKVQPYMRICFDNIYQLEFSKEGYTVSGIVSGEGERLPFIKACATKGGAESWLKEVQQSMFEVVWKHISEGLKDYGDLDRNIWVKTHKGQVVSTVSQIFWCAGTENSILQVGSGENPQSLSEWHQINVLQINGLTELVRGNLDDVQRKIIVALITTDVHARDILEKLIEQDVSSLSDFNWQQQLRYYWDESLGGQCVIKQVNTVLRYGYEYMGATSRLVITPLTDRCWMTITGAINIKLGAAPAGPAGTGKTESTKDLAKAIGMQCVVFNCSEQIDYKMMGRLFSGLAQQGAWACLDEFNRIDIEVLSVIAQQLQKIQLAQLKNLTEFEFLDDHAIPLKQTAAVFITMNPGYAGRTELPDNLKVLFRPVAMMIPDYRLIAEIMLAAEGFQDAKNLSNKMVRLYKLSSEQLSQQDHYDFGMRAVKSVLVMAGSLKRAEPNLSENVVLIRAMRDSNIPKFLKDDIPLFQAIVQDLFPGVNIPIVDYGELQRAILIALQKFGYQNDPKLIVKILQLFETFNVRFGVMLVGQTGSGKTTCYRVLAEAMSELRRSDCKDIRFQLVEMEVINPKCISMGELYGEVHPLTKDWNDGLASKIMRNYANDTGPNRKWVVFDGPVDALWIENMNTVLDDNMMLCLANGQRIKLRSEMRMLFEVQDLAVASPATVSRCGMVYLNFEDLTWRPYVYSWVERHFNAKNIQIDSEHIEPFLTDDLKKYLLQLFEDNVDLVLDKIRSGMLEPVQTTDLQLVQGLTNLLEAFISDEFGYRRGEKIEIRKRFIVHVFAYAFAWSIGASVAENHHDRMNDLIRSRFPTVLFPSIESVFSFYLDVSGGDLNFKLWHDKTPEFEFSKDTPYFNMLVQTIDTVRYSYFVDQLLNIGKPIYVTGYTGVGKSVMLQNLLTSIQEPRKIDPIYMIFSAQTSSIITQATIENKLEKIKKHLLGAKANRRNVIYIDDINMPSKEEYGAQPPIELLRFLVDRKELWDRKLLFLKSVENTNLLACSAPPGGGRSAPSLRFTRHFHVFCMPQPSQKTLFRIFYSILNGHLTAGFQESVKRLGDTIVQSTIEIYTRILAEKPPIPSKFHYTFNLRDVSKVFQGILMVKPIAIRDADPMIRLWIHESSRVFHDRLINIEDKTWFYKLIDELLAKNFKVKWYYTEENAKNKILFGDFLRLDHDRDYEEITGRMDKLLKTLEAKLAEYNIDFPTRMNLVFFEDAIDHILRIGRILRQPRGNAMLIGVGGSGKQSLTRLASFMLEYKIFQINLIKGYNKDSFKEDIKTVMRESVLDKSKKPISFIFTDTQIIDETFLEDINNLLNSGEVPNLWAPDERDNIIKETRPINTELKRFDEPETIYRTFIERVRNNLHIILCMSPVGEALRIRCRKFPSLVDCCTLNWFSSWPKEALLSVSKKFLREMVLSDDRAQNEEIRNNLSEICTMIHISSTEAAATFDIQLKRKVYTTPKSYLDLLNLYQNMLSEQRENMKQNQNRLIKGLKILEQTNKLVTEMQINLIDLQPKLVEQTEKTKIALQAVEIDSQKANEQEMIVEKEAEDVNQQASAVKFIYDNAKADLDKAMPALLAAEQGAKEIDPKQITALRSYSSPPKSLVEIMDAVCILLGEFKGESDWEQSKVVLRDAKVFLDRLQGYKKDSIPEAILFKLKKYLTMPAFTDPDRAAQISGAAVTIVNWVKAINEYANVFKVVEPKRKKAEAMQLQLDQANAVLAKKQEELAKIKANVARLKKECEEMIAKKQSLENEMELTKARLERAEKLTRLLADEGKRWLETVNSMHISIKNLVGDCFLSSAIISYCGPFTGPYRAKLLQSWLTTSIENKIPVSDNFTLVKILGDPAMIREWNYLGLPTDTVSIDNSLLATKSYRWPLMIDPQSQANKWIKNMEKLNNLKITKFSEPNFSAIMKAAIQNGHVVLIQDIEETLDPSIENILGRNVFESNDGRKLIRFGDSDIDYDDLFKLYITTKLPNPHYLPEIFIKVTIINFTVTFEGLEDQLLGDVVKNERREVEEQRDQNILNLSNYRKQLSNIENEILRRLSAVKGLIVDEIELIAALEISKVTASEIAIKFEQSIELEAQIEQIRSQYRDISIRGAILYFVIKDLALIDPMYQYSLQYINRLFNYAMSVTPKSNVLSERLASLIDNITRIIFINVTRGLFEAHKLIFSFLIAASINRQAKKLDERLWSIFLRGAGVYDKENQLPNPDKKLIREIDWELIVYLDLHFEKFKGLMNHVSEKINLWRDYAYSADPVFEPLPQEWNNTLDGFEKLLILKVFRGEKIMFGMSNYVNQELGSFYVDSLTFSMESVYNDSDRKTPIIFVLSQGADPNSNLNRYAKEKNFHQRFQTISLGQGQGETARKAIEKAKENGSWILLQNCHLSRTWMPQLELIVEEFAVKENEIHEDFRLFLTSMPAPYFPVSILQNGIKLTTEPPRGLRANLRRAYANLTQEYLDDCPKKDALHKMVFGLAFFHAIVQERRKFGPLGWNIRYEFNDSDLDTSKTVLKMLLSDQDSEAIPWDALLFVTGHINYGGRVTDDWDRRCLISILKKYYTTEILDEKYYLSESEVYQVPPIGSIENYRTYIESLPLTDDPEVFGMHENANVTYQSQESEKMITTVLSIQPREASSAGGKSNDETVSELSKAILETLPPILRKDEGKKELFTEIGQGLIAPLSTVLLQEMIRFNKLLETIQSSLDKIQKAIKGLLLMSVELDAMYYSLLNNQVPKMWAAYPSLKPLGSWIKDLHERVAFMREWLASGNPYCFWLSGFFYPQGFLTGVLQTKARNNGIPIDRLAFSFKILDLEKETVQSRPTDGVYVYGLYLEGASWDRKKKTLIDQMIGEMHCLMPVIYFSPIENYEPKDKTYNCPVYKTTVRAGVLSTTGESTNFVISVDMPTLEYPPETWTLRGTALMCQLND